jgi:translation elongation factor EF-1beta
MHFEALSQAPEAKYPNARAWYALVSYFTPEVRAKWAKKEDKKPKDKKPKETKPKEEAPKPAETKKEEAPKAITEDDMFGDDAGVAEAQKAMEEKQKKEAEEAEKKKKEKKKVVAKSYVKLEVKIYDKATDLDQLAQRIYAEVLPEGLVWEKDYTKEPFAFGVEKLLVSCIIEDEKISVDEDVKKVIRRFDDKETVQSVDILIFNKL